MTAITSREIADYIYTAIVIPLKGLELQSFDIGVNPFERMHRSASLDIGLKPEGRAMAHNYERRAYERTALLQVRFHEQYNTYIVGEYDREKRSLVIFGDVAREHGIMPFMSQLYRMFEKTYPYYKVKMVKGAHDAH